MSQAIMEVSDYLIEKANSPEAMKLLLIVSLVFVALFLMILWIDILPHLKKWGLRKLSCRHLHRLVHAATMG